MLRTGISMLKETSAILGCHYLTNATCLLSCFRSIQGCTQLQEYTRRHTQTPTNMRRRTDAHKDNNAATYARTLGGTTRLTLLV